MDIVSKQLRKFADAFTAKAMEKAPAMLTENAVQLDEDLGSLKAIRPEFVTAFKGLWRNGKLHNKLGQESPVHIEMAQGSARATFDLLISDPTIVGLILIVNGTQTMALVYEPEKHSYHSKGAPSNFNVIADSAMVKEILGHDKSKLEKVDKKFHGIYNTIADTKMSQADATQVFSYIFNAVKSNQAGGVQLMLVQADPVRTEKQSKRKVAKSGRIINPSSQKFAEDAVRELRSRFAEFKQRKSASFATPEEALEEMIKSGYAEFIRINEIPYELKNSRIDLGKLTQDAKKGGEEPRRDWEESYIEYRMTYEGRDAQRDKMRDMARQMAADANIPADEQKFSNPAFAEIYSKVEKTQAPETVKILFKLEGGKIVPFKVSMSLR